MQIIPSASANPGSPKIGRPAFELTLQNRKQVQDMAGLGIRQSYIAFFLGISARSLRRRFRAELDAGAASAEKNVLLSLYEMAVSRRNSAATIFWVKTRCDFDQRAPKSSSARHTSQSSPKSPTPKPTRRSSLEGLTAHLNDGAPNGEL
jgi:hypothetical protein